MGYKEKWCLLLVLCSTVNFSTCIYTPYEARPRKPTLSPGIKTANWKNSPSENVLMHHNYSHVNYQNPITGNALTPDQIVENKQKLYPVYRPDLEKTNGSEGKDGHVTNQKVIIRVKKQLQVYDKCPPGATGQFVYSLSCNQYLNCWKGRTFVQNCSPGTLFNPDTLTCDFPAKVRCITGPRQTMYEEPPPSASHTLNTRNVQPKCPKEFSGRMPNYANCSKFVVCTQGEAMNQICPPGTLFDTNRNICDFPKLARCFNGQKQDAQSQNIDYFVIGASNRVEEGVNPATPTAPGYYQTSYGTYQARVEGSRVLNQGTNCGNQNGCPKPFATHPPDGGHSGVLQGSNCGSSDCRNRIPSTSSEGFQNNNCNPSYQNCRETSHHITNNQGYTPSFTENVDQQSLGSSNIGAVQRPDCFPPNCGGNSGYVTSNSNTNSQNSGVPQYTDCGSSNSNCRGQQSSRGPTRPNYTTNIDQTPDSSNVRIISRCNPETSICQSVTNPSGQPSTPNSSSGGSNYGDQTRGSSNIRILSQCNPRLSNCGGNQNQDSQQLSPSYSGQLPSNQNWGKYPPSGCQSGQDCGQFSGGNQNGQQTSPSYSSQLPSNQNWGPYPSTGCQSGQNCGQVNGEGYTKNYGNSNYPSNQGTTDCVRENGRCVRYPYPNSRPQNPNQGSSYNPEIGQTARVPKTQQVQCPEGASGPHPHPYDCSKWLNCANGITFVQNCGIGTLFNPQIMNCDHDYNVECDKKGGPDIDDNSITSTRRTTTWRNTDDSGEIGMTTSYTYLTPDYPKLTTGRGDHYITRPPKLPNFKPNQDYDDIGSNHVGFATGKPNQHIDQALDNDYKRETVPKLSQKDKTWPPPFPATDTNADYVFEYFDVDQAPIIDPQNAHQVLEVDCTKGGFDCNNSLKKCIPKNLVCDGTRNCPNNNDEQGCSKHLEKFEVKRGIRLAVIEKERWDNTTVTSCAYLCLESKKFDCKSFNYRNVDSCCFLSDVNEGMTGRLMAYQPNDYYELKSSKLDCSNMFTCNNNKCIKKSQVCDGQNDCGEREDEKNCPSNDIGYNIRLAGTNNSWSGRIEVAAFGKVGFICDDRFDLKNANVVCKELGYPLGATEVKSNSYFAQDVPLQKVFYMMDDVICQGNETSLKDCDFNGWGSHDCTNQEVVGVVCKGEQEQKCPDTFWKCKTTNECVPMAFVCDGPEDCTDGSEETDELCRAPVDVRLVNGTNGAEGRIEVKYHGVWGTICDDDFNDDAAKVICKNLGFKGTVTVKKEAYFGEGNGPIWLDQVTCFGNETKLDKCSHWNWGEHNCDHSEDVGVICSNSDTSDIERHVKKPQAVKTAPFSADPSYPIYPTSCGLRKYSLLTPDSDAHFRVVQGSKAKPGDYPWQAALRVKGKLHLAHWCGAVVISSDFVLTAAHCLVGYPKGAYVVVAGDYNVEEDEGTEQHAYIEDFYIHEDFRKGHKMNNDIALVKLKGNGFKLNQDVQAICLPDLDTNYEVDLNCTISGFGSIESGTSAFSNELRAGQVPLQRENVCKMPHVYGPSLTDGMFCAGTLDGGTDACDGDSGGPLACLDEGLYTLYGITSWGQRCGYANKPGVYVKIAHYRKWIDDKIRKNI